MNSFLIYNARIISPDFDAPHAAVLVKDKKIVRIYVEGESLPTNVESFNLNGKMLMPGFFDVHTHGGSGFETTDAIIEHLETIGKDKLKQGVTSWLPTTLTLGKEQLAEALNTCAIYDSAGVGAKIVGVHLEGPYINPKNLGAQNPAHVRKPDIEEVKILNEFFRVLKVSYAVETDGGDVFASELRSIGITPSCVHSSATYTQFLKAYSHGLRDLTHFCNQMTPLHHRDIGLVGAGFLHSDVFIEIICDKIHLSPQMIELIFKLKDINTIQLITDSCQAAGMADGEYEIGGLPIVVKNKEARLTSNGALAGSVLTMNEALKNTYEITKLPLKYLVKTTSYNQAKSLGLAGIGKIEAGYNADLVALDDEFNVCNVWVGGVSRV